MLQKEFLHIYLTIFAGVLVNLQTELQSVSLH